MVLSLDIQGIEICSRIYYIMDITTYFGIMDIDATIVTLNDEFHAMRTTIATLIDQNRMLVEIVQRGKSSSSDATKPTYIGNVLKPTTWDIDDKQNIEVFLTEYETYCDASWYNADEVRVRNFGSFLKDGASIAFAAWQKLVVEILEGVGD